MKKKAIPKRQIELAVRALNDYFDNHLKPGSFIQETFFIKNGICSEKDVNALIARLEGFGLITYQESETFDTKIIERLPLCATYFERKNDAARQAAFAKTISIISLIISLTALAITIIKFFIDISPSIVS